MKTYILLALVVISGGFSSVVLAEETGANSITIRQIGSDPLGQIVPQTHWQSVARYLRPRPTFDMVAAATKPSVQHAAYRVDDLLSGDMNNQHQQIIAIYAALRIVLNDDFAADEMRVDQAKKSTWLIFSGTKQQQVQLADYLTSKREDQ